MGRWGSFRTYVSEWFPVRDGVTRHPWNRGLRLTCRGDIVLALLVTSSQHRRRGAGSLLVEWGIDKSDEVGLPAYVQASEQGRRLFWHHGFRDVDTVMFNLSNYGSEGVVKMTEMLRGPAPNAESEHKREGDAYHVL